MIKDYGPRVESLTRWTENYFASQQIPISTSPSSAHHQLTSEPSLLHSKFQPPMPGFQAGRRPCRTLVW